MRRHHGRSIREVVDGHRGGTAVAGGEAGGAAPAVLWELLRYREPVCVEVTGPSGVVYQVEVEAFWDDRKRRDLRVLASIDDGGWRAFSPLCDDFIIATDGSFVGE